MSLYEGASAIFFCRHLNDVHFAAFRGNFRGRGGASNSRLMRSEWSGLYGDGSNSKTGDDSRGAKNGRFISGDLGMLNGCLLTVKAAGLLLGHLHKQPSVGPHTQTLIQFIIILVLEMNCSICHCQKGWAP